MPYRAKDNQDEGDVHTGTRVCRHCSERKPMTEFHWASSRVHRARTCKACQHARQASRSMARSEEKKESDRASRLMRQYGITVEQLESMRLTQRNRCGLCRKALEERFHVDHDHSTGYVRELLCHNCNLGLGHFYDDEDLILKAADYIRRHRERTALLGQRPQQELTPAERKERRAAAARRQLQSESHKRRVAAALGNRNATAKLSESDVRNIREAYARGGVTQQQLADKYGVAQTHISVVVRKGKWAHVE